MNAIPGAPDEIETRLGAALRQWRVDAGYSQEELAERASLSRSAIQGLESGQGSRLATLIRILRALDRTDALDAFTPREGPSPIELLAQQRRAARAGRPPRASRVGRRA